MSKLISIIVNCYNGEKYLKQTLESIQKQNYTNWELIFWDNHSTDTVSYTHLTLPTTRYV